MFDMQPLYADVKLESKIPTEVSFTYEDINIVPRYSDIESRDEVSTTSKLTRHIDLLSPLIASPMATVCDGTMADAVSQCGGAGIIHRFCSIDEQVTMVQQVNSISCRAAAIGVTGDVQERTNALLNAGTNVICIDVAHGFHSKVIRVLQWLNEHPLRNTFDIIVGNICTAEAAIDLESEGADALRVGIGNGSNCTTRMATGIGVPQASAIIDVARVATIPIIADGNIRTPSDVCKALCLGADTAMIGSMFSGLQESPGEVISRSDGKYKLYSGSASEEQKMAAGMEPKYIEGVSRLVKFNNESIYDVTRRIMDGVRSCMSYLGVNNIKEMREVAQFVRVTQAGQIEASAHGLRQ